MHAKLSITLIEVYKNIYTMILRVQNTNFRDISRKTIILKEIGIPVYMISNGKS